MYGQRSTAKSPRETRQRAPDGSQGHNKIFSLLCAWPALVGGSVTHLGDDAQRVFEACATLSSAIFRALRAGTFSAAQRRDVTLKVMEYGLVFLTWGEQGEFVRCYHVGCIDSQSASSPRELGPSVG